jgi:YHS domain-containing protein
MKSRHLFAIAVLAAIGIASAGALIAQDEDAASEEIKITEAMKCPVSGQPVKAEHKVSYKGKDVFFCCPNCPTAFKADSDKYAAKTNLQLAQTKQIVQVACPLTGRDINPEATVEVSAATVAFCCENCQGKVAQAPAPEQITLVFADIKKGFTLQTKCPVSGKPIKAEHAVTHNDSKVYFCCPNCPAAFEANPEKFAANIKAQKGETEEPQQ